MLVLCLLGAEGLLWGSKFHPHLLILDAHAHDVKAFEKKHDVALTHLPQRHVVKPQNAALWPITPFRRTRAIPISLIGLVAAAAPRRRRWSLTAVHRPALRTTRCLGSLPHDDLHLIAVVATEGPHTLAGVLTPKKRVASPGADVRANLRQDLEPEVRHVLRQRADGRDRGHHAGAGVRGKPSKTGIVFVEHGDLLGIFALNGPGAVVVEDGLKEDGLARGRERRLIHLGVVRLLLVLEGRHDLLEHLLELFRRLLREGLVDLPLLHQAHHKLDLLLAHGSLVAYALPGEDALERLQQLALKTLSVVLGLALARQVRHRVQDVEPHAGVAGLGRLHDLVAYGLISRLGVHVRELDELIQLILGCTSTEIQQPLQLRAEGGLAAIVAIDGAAPRSRALRRHPCAPKHKDSHKGPGSAG